jgi:hypothetical protein
MKADKDQEEFVFHFMDILSAPVLTHTTSWADAIPPRLMKIITMARLKAGLQKEQLATFPEVTAFMITRTFEAPMDHDWTEIYTFVSCTVCEEYFGEDHWSQVCPDKRLNDYQQDLLLRLRRWIYEKRRLAVHKRIKLQGQKGAIVGKFISEPFNFE